MGGLTGCGWVVEVDTLVSHTASLNPHPAEPVGKGAGRGVCAGHGALLPSCLSGTWGPGPGLGGGDTSVVDPGYCGCVCPWKNPRCTL